MEAQWKRVLVELNGQDAVMWQGMKSFLSSCASLARCDDHTIDQPGGYGVIVVPRYHLDPVIWVAETEFGLWVLEYDDTETPIDVRDDSAED